MVEPKFGDSGRIAGQIVRDCIDKNDPNRLQGLGFRLGIRVFRGFRGGGVTVEGQQPMSRDGDVAVAKCQMSQRGLAFNASKNSNCTTSVPADLL